MVSKVQYGIGPLMRKREEHGKGMVRRRGGGMVRDEEARGVNRNGSLVSRRKKKLISP